MLYTAIMALLAAFVAKWSNNLLGQALTERPLVAGLIAGLFLGDVQTGVLVGAALEAVFLGMVDVGGSVTAEPVTATVLAVAFVSTMGMEQGTAVALAVPIGLLGGLVYSVIHLSISSLAAPSSRMPLPRVIRRRSTSSGLSAAASSTSSLPFRPSWAFCLAPSP